MVLSRVGGMINFFRLHKQESRHFQESSTLKPSYGKPENVSIPLKSKNLRLII
jgi:hypothetical protein